MGRFQKRVKINVSESYIITKIEERAEAKNKGDFSKADKIRDELFSRYFNRRPKRKTVWKLK